MRKGATWLIYKRLLTGWWPCWVHTGCQEWTPRRERRPSHRPSRQRGPCFYKEQMDSYKNSGVYKFARRLKMDVSKNGGKRGEQRLIRKFHINRCSPLLMMTHDDSHSTDSILSSIVTDSSLCCCVCVAIVIISIVLCIVGEYSIIFINLFIR